MKDEFIAHVLQHPDGSWAPPHDLNEHLAHTAALASAFAAKFLSADWGHLAGVSHDVGKGRDVWRHYIMSKSGFGETGAHLEGKASKVPHAIFGAKLVESVFGRAIGRILSYPIAGHHGGLPDWSSGDGAGQSALEFRLAQATGLDSLTPSVTEPVRVLPNPQPPWRFGDGLDASLWIRMVFSCLVDADFIDTESYMDSDRSSQRGGYETIGELLRRLNEFNERLDSGSEDTPVNQIRRRVRRRCCDMAVHEPGIFSLSVPTGGGKTLSSLTFALNHAALHGLDRVIYVIPYTSILEQNADVFRRAVGNDQVVEHHSSLGEDDSTPRLRIACENWDAPIIVTTSVQFYESLFASLPSRCRKLHNVARAVVVLDEAQLIPVEYLRPILETIQLLCERYGTSFLISTATQPAFSESIEGAVRGLSGIKEIVGDDTEVRALYGSLKRVDVSFPQSFHTPISWEELADELKQYKQVLCIVSDRKSCRELHKLMPEGTFHLSALMCGQHRSEVIDQIKVRLRNEDPVCVISTQLVEAGVDLDFPVVYRALAGLDSIAQAAGRCNREGRLEGMGKVVVFVPPRKAPVGILRKATETTVSLLAEGSRYDSLDPQSFSEYFSALFSKAISLDSHDIVGLLSRDRHSFQFGFRTAAEKFRIIDSTNMRSVLVRYGEGNYLIEELRVTGGRRDLLRRLQRYSVDVYTYDFARMWERRLIEEVQPEIFALTSDMEYSNGIGLLVDRTMHLEGR